MILSITSVADCCRPSCQGEGCPSPAVAVPAPAREATAIAANAVNRFDTSIIGSFNEVRPLGFRLAHICVRHTLSAAACCYRPT
jgi:hypothetical protein